MKKVLSILLAAILTFSTMFSLGMAVHAETPNTPLFYRFNTEAATTASLDISGSGVNRSFDAEAEAAKLTVRTVSTGGNTMRFKFNWRALGDYTFGNYPIFAMRFKLGKTTMTGRANNFGFTSAPNASPVFQLRKDFSATTDWQTVIIDTSTGAFTSAAIWDNTLIKMIEDTTLAVGDTIHIEWAGMFATEADVEAMLPVAPVSMVYTYNSLDSLSTIVNTTTTLKTYDSIENAAKLTLKTAPTTGGNSIRFTVDPVTIANSCDTHPIFAMKIKLSKAAMTGRDNNITCIPSVTTGTAVKGAKMLMERTTRWQTVMFDTTQYPGETWKQVLFKLIDDTTLELGDYVLIQWIGLFTTAAEVTALVGDADTSPEINDPTPLFYDFSRQSDINRVNVTQGTFTKTLDTAEEAMKLTLTKAAGGVDTFRMQIGWDADYPTYPYLKNLYLSSDTHGYFAARIKLSNPEIKAHAWAAYGWNGTFQSDRSLYPTGGATPKYEETDEWQTIIMDLNMFYTQDNNFWKEILIKFADTSTINVGDSVYIKWMGLFETKEDIYDYLNEEPPVTLKKIACVGDSITYGTGSTSFFTTAYPAQLQTLLGKNIDVRNFGVSGATLRNAGSKPYTTSASGTRYQDSLDFEPDEVIICLGTNDLNSMGADNNLVAEYEADMIALINSYKALDTNPTIYLATTPYNWKGVNLAGRTIQAEVIVPLQKRLAEELDIVLVDIYAATYGKDDLLPDGVHPSDEGYTLLANTYYKALTGSAATLETDLYTEQDGAFFGVAGYTSIEDFKAGFANAGNMLKALSGDAVVTEGYIATGMQICAINPSGDILDSAYVVIYGDIAGHGMVNSEDITLSRKNLLETHTLTSWSLAAADANADGQVDVKDLIRIKKISAGF